jgi:hypothetical protein
MTDDKSKKWQWLGAPNTWKLELAAQTFARAFNVWGSDDGFGGLYLVGSAMERPDWRDVDLRCILEDGRFRKMFPDVHSLDSPTWEHDPLWMLMCTMISDWFKAQTGLPVDFQFQPMTFANARHDKARQPVGLMYAKPEPEEGR